MSLTHLRRPGARLVAAAAALLLATALAAALPTSPAGAAAARTWSVTRPVCAPASSPTAFRCFAERSYSVPAGTGGAQVSARVGHGPAGGYTPYDLAKAYGFNPAARVNQTVAIVDWYDDPYVLADLTVFDRQYHLPAETSTSFRKVNQNGKAAPLPKPSRDMAGEITLDVEAVRGVCNRCRIVLVEANYPTSTDLALSENTAARLGATEISNSWGGPEGSESKRLVAAFKHPGVVITASTGDDGWYGWDYVNDGESDGDNAASFPSTSPYVVSVGGTQLTVRGNGTRATETVWNDDGPSDASGASDLTPEGASGGGCSRRYAAPTWQVQQAGFAATGCGTHRSAADIAALASPAYGLDVYDRYGSPLYTSKCSTAHPNGGCWARAGGTSLSSPVIAAMYALAGGSGGAAYPAASLYVNSRRTSSVRYDVAGGGNSFCGGASASACSAATFELSGYTTNNPNQLTSVGDLLDCSFPRNTLTVDPAALPKRSQCNATAGFDGPTGVGTPAGLRVFADTSPNATIVLPVHVRHATTRTYTSTLSTTAGARIVAVGWTWGDGKSTTGSAGTARATHRYARAGTYTITYSARDSFGQTIYRTRTVRVS